MENKRNMLIAFLLNLSFSAIELAGGFLTGSVAIAGDAIHDLGDALSIGFSCLLEHKSERKPDDNYTYGYTRFSVLGSLLTSVILFLGSIGVIFKATQRLMDPKPINYNAMLWLAVFGVVMNFAASLFTRGGGSLNQRAVNLHMLEDTLGWAAVLVCAVMLHFTDWVFIDSIISIAVALFILMGTFKNFKTVLDIFLEKTPRGISVNKIKEYLIQLDGVADVHHVHVRSIDGFRNYASAHVVLECYQASIKERIREELSHFGIVHSVLEIELMGEECQTPECTIDHGDKHSCTHHHHH